MKSVALLTFGLLTACYPAMAKPYHVHYGRYYVARTVHHANIDHHASFAHHTNVSGEHESHSGITCEMVRAYVAQVGLAQAAAMAQSAGATSSDKERARRCLEQKS
jgi:hypothetical protein